MKLPKPKHDCAKALYILNLNYLGGVSMAKVLNHEPNFYKFQTRLSDIQRWHKKLNIAKTTIPYKSKIDGKSKHYKHYTVISPKQYFHNLYLKLNDLGLYRARKSAQK